MCTRIALLQVLVLNMLPLNFNHNNPVLKDVNGVNSIQ